jgi:hypothetical protein
MDDPPAAAMPKPCCVCAAQNGKHCAKCKSRHYCSKACQLVDWKQGHNKACRQLAAAFQDRLLDEIMPLKLKIKEEPAIVDDVLSADGSKAAARLPAARTQTTAVVKATAVKEDVPDWRGTCAICLELLPLNGEQTFYECCCKRICNACFYKCQEYDQRCPLCRASTSTSDAENLRQLQKHADKGNAEAQFMLGVRTAYGDGEIGLKKNLKRAIQLYECAAAQGHAHAQSALGRTYERGDGVKIDYKTAAQWHRRAAEQDYPLAQSNLGTMFYHGKGVPQSYDEAVRWYRLAAAQGHADALYYLGVCCAKGQGMPKDYVEALRLFKRGAAKGHVGAAEAADKVAAGLEAHYATHSADRHN